MNLNERLMGEIAWSIFVREKVASLRPDRLKSGFKEAATKLKVDEAKLKKCVSLALFEGYGLRISMPDTNDFSHDEKLRIALEYVTEEIRRDGVKFKPDGFEREIGRIVETTGRKKEEIKNFYMSLLEKVYSEVM